MKQSHESFAEQLSRVLLMSEDHGDTWDLSDNDKAALKAVLAALADAVAAIPHAHGHGQESAIRDANAGLIDDLIAERLSRPLSHCAKCGMSKLEHCDFDEPGLDHSALCDKMHHEFNQRPISL